MKPGTTTIPCGVSSPRVMSWIFCGSRNDGLWWPSIWRDMAQGGGLTCSTVKPPFMAAISISCSRRSRTCLVQDRAAIARRFPCSCSCGCSASTGARRKKRLSRLPGVNSLPARCSRQSVGQLHWASRTGMIGRPAERSCAQSDGLNKSYRSAALPGLHGRRSSQNCRGDRLSSRYCRRGKRWRNGYGHRGDAEKEAQEETSPEATIVVPVLADPRAAEATVVSCLKQTVVNRIEIILVEKETARTALWSERYPQAHVISSPRADSIVEAHFAGLAAAQSKGSASSCPVIFWNQPLLSGKSKPRKNSMRTLPL